MIGFLDHLESRGRLLRRWIAAGTIMGALHVGGGALALMTWPEEETDAEPEGAFLIELAPMAVSPKDDSLSLPIGLRSEDVAATPPPVEEVKEKQPDEIPPVEESPAPNPEVAFQKQEPLKEIEEKKPQESVAQTVESLAAAPPPIETAAVAPKPAAPLQGTSRKPSVAEVSWQKSLHLHLNKNKKYPADARNKGVQGVVTVGFVINREGKVISSQVMKSSGSDLLDAEALATLERASPLPAPPEDYPDETPFFSIPIKFNIK
jgi:TonB family protein